MRKYFLRGMIISILLAGCQLSVTSTTSEKVTSDLERYGFKSLCLNGVTYYLNTNHSVVEAYDKVTGEVLRCDEKIK